LTVLVLLWLAGAALRLTILAVPPVMPLIHDDLHLSETQVGILASLPPVLFALAAIPGSFLIARFGPVLVLAAGLLICAAASALRGVAPHLFGLYAATFAMAFGVAIMQPSLPPTVRQWLPDRIGLGTAVYTNGLILGEIFPVALTLPLVVPVVDGSWRAALAAWSIPVFIIAVLVVALGPRRSTALQASVARLGWPDWKDPLVWRVGLLLGCANSVYFAANGFLADYLTSLKRTDLIGAALTSLNVAQLPASFLVLAFNRRMEGKAWPYLIAGAFTLLGVFVVAVESGEWVVIGAGMLGFAAAFILILTLALPALLSKPEDVHRVSAGMFAISYSMAVIVPIASGMLWDASGMAILVLVPLTLCGFGIIVLGATLPNLHSRTREVATRAPQA
jgi:CP family cyanate transporter-like MFS transporter